MRPDPWKKAILKVHAHLGLINVQKSVKMYLDTDGLTSVVTQADIGHRPSRARISDKHDTQLHALGTSSNSLVSVSSRG